MAWEEAMKKMAEVLLCMATCPSAPYCLRVGRIECPTCPVRPEAGTGEEGHDE